MVVVFTPFLTALDSLCKSGPVSLLQKNHYESQRSHWSVAAGYSSSAQSPLDRSHLRLLVASLYPCSAGNARRPSQREKTGTFSNKPCYKGRRGGDHSEPGVKCRRLFLRARSGATARKYRCSAS